jgi:transcriptional regulator with XRE-family HTH domain
MEQSTSELTAGAVRAELARHRISGRELGRAIGWSLGTTSRRLNGRSPITVDELSRIAGFIGVPLSDLLPMDRAA